MTRCAFWFRTAEFKPRTLKIVTWHKEGLRALEYSFVDYLWVPTNLSNTLNALLPKLGLDL